MGDANAGQVEITESPQSHQLRLSIKRAHGRVANVTADLLRTKLYVPNVFLNPKIVGVPAIDVLAVDRGGSGDLHAVEIKFLSIFPTRTQFKVLLRSLKSLPFHFKYLALPGFSPDLSDPTKFTAYYPELFNESGIGRVGIISFDHRVLDGSAEISSNSAVLTIRPERFLLRDEKLDAVERFLSKARPDMAVRI